MKVIFLKDVNGKGKKDQILDVSDGYARNFLIPKGFAVVADNVAINELKNKEAARLHKIDVERNEAKAVAEKLSASVVKIICQAGADGKLYGSVTAKDIADKLKAQFGVEVDKRKMIMPEAIKAFGSYSVDIKLYNDVTGKINIVVSDEK